MTNCALPERLRVVLIAPCCDPDDVGEAKIAYEWAVRIAERHDTTILTYHKRDREPATGRIDGARVVEWREPALVGRSERFNSLLKPAYVSFYRKARSRLRAQLAAGERIDVVHQLIPMAARYPSPAAGLGVPLVVGPLAGSLPTPPGFADEMATAAWYTRLRQLDRWRLRHDPVLRQSLAQADAVIGAMPYVRELLADVPIRRFEVMPELGVDDAAFAATPPTTGAVSACREHAVEGVVRLLFVGRVIRTKGARDLIRATARGGDVPHVVVDIVGEGDDRAACEAEATALGVADRVRFWGWQPRERVEQFYEAADVFVFPSFREPTGGVVAEALRHGLPLIVADSGGPAGLVSDDCAMRVAVTEPEQYAADLADAIRAFALDPRKRARFGRAARDHAMSTLGWSHKLAWLDELYTDVAARPAGVRSA